MSATDFARHEFERAELQDSPLAQDVLALLAVYDRQRHNDPSAIIETFTRLAAAMPLMPLTGEPGEWFEVLPGTEQNKRCASVFRDLATGIAYDAAAYVFENPLTGARMVDERSRVAITFPYYPRSRIVQMTPPGSEQAETLPVLPSEGEGHG